MNPHAVSVLGGLFLALGALQASAQPGTLDLASGLDALRQQQDQAAFEAARQMAEETSLGPAGARAQMETLAVYRGLRGQSVTVDWDSIGMPADPGASVLAVVRRVDPESSWKLDDLDPLIARDEAFLAQQGNNSTNDDYARDRLAALRTLRAKVAEGLVRLATELATQGDELMQEQIAHGHFGDLETRARRAESTLGAAANGDTMTQFAQTLERLRDATRRSAQMARTTDLHAGMASLEPEGEAVGDYKVAVLHIQSETFNGSLPAGKRTTLALEDRYVVVVDTNERFSERRQGWLQEYQYDWCRYRNIHQYVARSQLSFLIDHSGLSKAAAQAIGDKAKEALVEAGYPYKRRGYAGPADGSRVPFTVPSNVEDIPSCKSERRNAEANPRDLDLGEGFHRTRDCSVGL